MSCPICKGALPPSDNKYRPFCSHRCQLIDLGNWLGERYAVPGEEVDKDETAPSLSSAEAEKRPE